MMNIHHIELIADIESLGLVKEEFQYPYEMWVSKGKNPLEKEAIFKCKDVTPSEIFGYALATMLDMPVPKFQGVWLEGELDHASCETGAINPMGILVERVRILKKPGLERLVQHDSKLAAKYLVLLLFDRFESIAIFKIAGYFAFLDLERIGPQMCTGDSEEELAGNRPAYVNETDDQWSKILKLACQNKILDEFVLVFREIKEILNSVWLTDFVVTGHPRSEEMSRIFVEAIRDRYFRCTKNVGQL